MGATGAIGGVVGEITAEEIATKLEEMAYTGIVKKKDVQKWVNAGVDMSTLVAGLAAAVAGADIDTAAVTANNAADNNALGIIAICVIALAAEAYTLIVGDGDCIDGLERIGEGNHPLAEALEKGTQTAVEMSYEHYPEATEAALDVLVKMDELEGVVFKYVDEATGEVASKLWEDLDESTRNRIKGFAEIVEIFIPAPKISILRKARNALPLAKIAKKADPLVKIAKRFPDGKVPNLKVHAGKQNKHIIGTNEYKTATLGDRYKSIIYEDVDVQRIVDKYAGSGVGVRGIKGQAGYVEVVEVDTIVGEAVGKTGENLGSTKWISIHYANDGVHIVPIKR